MTHPTPEQQSLLDGTARVRIVRAAPGSGKTWLVAEVIRKELAHWSGGGIAALSFTRVGGDAIHGAVGHELDHPHFVGTLDAFMFRFVLRPFLRKCFPWFPDVRLVPGEWGAEHWRNREHGTPASVGQGMNLFGCVFIDEEDGQAVVAHKPPHLTMTRLSGDDAAKVKSAKMDFWKKRGRLTHSDAALWASKVLAHENLGAMIRAEVVRRFPLLIVDELQDAGHFLGKSIRLLLDGTSGRGVLVGDPDQAIYEFNGARPALFEGFTALGGAVIYPLSRSRRCPAAVATVAGHLRSDQSAFAPADDKSGRTVLVRFDDMAPDVRRLAEAFQASRPRATIKVVARSKKTVTELVGCSAKSPPQLGSPPLNHMHRAVVHLGRGAGVAALAAARAALDLAVFGHEGLDDAALEKSGIDAVGWKRLAASCLFRAHAVVREGSVRDWQMRVGKAIDEAIAASGLPPAKTHVSGRLKPNKTKKKGNHDEAAAPCVDFLPPADASAQPAMRVPVQTVHAVKGETHDATIFVCPHAGQERHCVSTVWWNMAGASGGEEKRIAYVAMTRTQRDLVLFVSQGCFSRLSEKRDGFLQCFECMNTDEAIISLCDT